MKKVLVVCHDTVGAKMAGPGIRYQFVAQQIKKVADVTLAVFSNGKETASKNGIAVVPTTNNGYQNIFDKHDVIFAQWLSGEMLDYAKAAGKIVIIDLYAPVPIEYLASLGFSSQSMTAQKDLEFSGILETYTKYLSMADYLVCSNERQRDFWIGYITSANILKPTNFSNDLKIDKLALCPMGISSIAPKKSALLLRKRAGLDKDDFVMLWTGGIWDWFDAQLIIKAVHKLNNPKVKLVFMGTEHPNDRVVEMSESKKARTLAKDLKLVDKSVFFLDGWVDYDKRASYLMDADVAIYADKDSAEARFSHRTRVLDHIWASLPTICTRGDYMSEVLDKSGMGIIVNERTPESFAKVIDNALRNPSLLNNIKANIDRERHKFTWDVLSKDLLKFIERCEVKKKSSVQKATSATSPQAVSYSDKAKQRIKNSIKVLLGKVDV